MSASPAFLKKKPGYEAGGFIYALLLIISSLGALLWLSGCTDKSQAGADLAAKVGESSLSLSEFESRFESERDSLVDGESIHNARLRFLRQLVEEMLVLECARSMGITVSPEQVSEAERQIREDYSADYSGLDQPESEAVEGQDQFEQIFVEQVVPYEAWKKALERRLLIEEVVQRQVGESVLVTEEEVELYLEENPPVSRPDASDDGEVDSRADEQALDPDALKETVRSYLKAVKMEQAYGKWLLDLKKQFTVQVWPERL